MRAIRSLFATTLRSRPCLQKMQENYILFSEDGFGYPEKSSKDGLAHSLLWRVFHHMKVRQLVGRKDSKRQAIH
jgi:hypothetical protein